jgi:predicted MFS family arabinose efflux permease
MSASLPKRSLVMQLLVTTPIRVLLNTAYRMVYPFLPEFSRGLGISPETLAQLLAARSGLGLAGPLFGLVPDRFGRRLAMVLGLVIFSFALLVVAVWPNFYTFAGVLFAVRIATALHDPALIAHLGDQTPYAQRGRVLGISEFGWAGATFLGIPLLGILIGRSDWQAPFWPLAILGCGAIVAMLWVIVEQRGSITTRSLSFNINWKILVAPHLLAVLSLGGIISFANEILSVVYGRWMEQVFSLGVEARGYSVIVIGVAELLGEGLVAAFADRLGKRRMVLIATLLAALAYAGLPFLGKNVWLALGGIFLVYLCFETGIVANIPILTELVPEARSTVLSTSVMLNGIGRTVGALFGAWLFSYSFVWVGMFAALVNVLALVVVWFGVRRGS